MQLLQATYLRYVNQYLPVIHVHPCIVLATAAAHVWKSPAMQSNFESYVILRAHVCMCVMMQSLSMFWDRSYIKFEGGGLDRWIKAETSTWTISCQSECSNHA